MAIMEKLLRYGERSAAALSGIVMILVTCVVVSDVVMRYFFRMPWPWAYDVITIYLMTALFYLGFPLANKQRANIAVDIAMHYFPVRIKHLVEFLSAAISLLVFSVITWVIFKTLTKQINTREVIQGYYDYPTYIASLFIVIGSFLICIRSVVRAALHFVSAITGRDLCELPSLPGSE